MTEIQHSGDRVALMNDQIAKDAATRRLRDGTPNAVYRYWIASGSITPPHYEHRVPWRALLILFALGVPVVVGWLRFVR